MDTLKGDSLVGLYLPYPISWHFILQWFDSFHVYYSIITHETYILGLLCLVYSLLEYLASLLSNWFFYATSKMDFLVPFNSSFLMIFSSMVCLMPTFDALKFWVFNEISFIHTHFLGGFLQPCCKMWDMLVCFLGWIWYKLFLRS